MTMQPWTYHFDECSTLGFLDCERYALKAAMGWPRRALPTMIDVDLDCFRHPVHNAIWTAVRNLEARGAAIGLFEVAVELERTERELHGEKDPWCLGLVCDVELEAPVGTWLFSGDVTERAIEALNESLLAHCVRALLTLRDEADAIRRAARRRKTA